MTTLVLSRRDNSSPWGFRMQGGLDFSSPLTVARVTPGTIAANVGLQTGDVILSVNGHDVSNAKHSDAQRLILDAGNCITFKLKRPDGRGSGNPPFASSLAGRGGMDGTDSGAAVSGMQNLTIGGAKPLQSARYDDTAGSTPAYAGYINPDNQSQAFKVLQSAVDSGKGLAPGVQPWQRHTVNEPSLEPKKYTPSPTFLMLQAEESGAVADDTPAVATGSGASQSGAHVKAAPFKPQNPGHVHVTPLKPGVPQPNPVIWTPPADEDAATFPPPPPPPPPPAATPSWQPPPATGRNATGSGSGVGVRGSATVSQPNIDLSKIPICDGCRQAIRGPFVVALGKSWCPNHFTCAMCNVQLVNIGFIELGGAIYCETDYERHFAPACSRCNRPVVGDAVNALNKTWHPKCFVCSSCSQPITAGSFHVEDGKPYCTKDWSVLFQIKCKGCDFPVEPGDKWVEALGSNYHAGCFNCAVCSVNLEGKPFFAKSGKAYCKTHGVSR